MSYLDNLDPTPEKYQTPEPKSEPDWDSLIVLDRIFWGMVAGGIIAFLLAFFRVI